MFHVLYDRVLNSRDDVNQVNITLVKILCSLISLFLTIVNWVGDTSL